MSYGRSHALKKLAVNDGVIWDVEVVVYGLVLLVTSEHSLAFSYRITGAAGEEVGNFIGLF